MSGAVVLKSETSKTTPIVAVNEANLDSVLKEIGSEAVNWTALNDYKAREGSFLLVPRSGGGEAAVLFGAKQDRLPSPFALGVLAANLPAGDYELADGFPDLEHAVLGFGLSSYRFTRYKNAKDICPRLVIPEKVDADRIALLLRGVALARDLINTPASDLGPEDLAKSVQDLFERHGGSGTIISGENLLEMGFPMVHAVGRASSRTPCLADFSWGSKDHPKITLVGKGVVFDTGGLDIKPANAMSLMKKDMGGAANVMGLASMIMEAKVPVRLRVIVPCVENAVSGSAFRPGDILRSRKGLTVEIGNTDAEGRLVLADALALADEEDPDLLIDIATLTGAARVALGPDMPPFYTHDEELAGDLSRISQVSNDPLWRLPLWQPYMKYLDSKIADINHINTSGAGFAGSVTAALFLSRFVERASSWAHFDIYGWTPMEAPGKPFGGEAQGIRCLFDLIVERFSTQV